MYPEVVKSPLQAPTEEVPIGDSPPSIVVEFSGGCHPIRNGWMVDNLNQILVGISKVERSSPVRLSFGFSFESYTVRTNPGSPLIDILRTPNDESEMIESLSRF